jgi:hypothetical protein
VDFLKTKSAATKAILQRIQSWKLRVSLTTKRYRADGEPELHAPALTDKLRDQGKSIANTAPRSSAQNAIAKRRIRTIFKAARAALAAARIHKRFWSLAVADVVEKSKYIPKRKGDGKVAVPRRAFDPTDSSDPGHFLPFGQHDYATNVDPNRNKLQPRARLLRYIGAINKHLYTTCDPATNAIRTTRTNEFQPTQAQSGVTAAAAQAKNPRISEPKTLRQAHEEPDAAEWPYTNELRRHDTVLKTLTYEQPLTSDCPMPYIANFKAKTNQYGGLERRKVHIAIRGDRMRPDRDFDPTRTAAHMPSMTGRRLLLAVAVANKHPSRHGTFSARICECPMTPTIAKPCCIHRSLTANTRHRE